jgi:hypothetical protein
VAGIVAALAADDDIGRLREVIDDLALAFVPPLEACDDGVHEVIEDFLTANGRE